MKKLVIALSLLCSLSLSAQNKYAKYATQFTRSEIKRHPVAWALDGTKSPKLNYTQGLELQAMYGTIPMKEWIAYAKTYTDSLIFKDCTIKGYKMSDYKLDAVNSGKMLMLLYKETKEQRYKAAMDTLYKQMLAQPRTPEGGFWHKKIYPEQMWLDGQYMGLPFYLEYAKRFTKKAEYDKVYADICKQIQLVYDKTMCPECHLCHHAWDSAHKQPWCNKETGRSQHAWGRAEGWFMMALVDMLDFRYDGKVPAGSKDPLVTVLNDLMPKILKLQDARTHTWQQVLDCTGRQGNYQEMTCSAMFADALLKGARIGAYQGGQLTNAQAKKEGKDAVDGIMEYYLTADNEGLLSLHNCCNVAGLSDKRDGSFEYYLSEPIIDNDPKGVGPLLFAWKELSK